MSRRLIINADDYGLSPAVSAGILQAAQGLVTSTTVMANLVTPLELKFLVASGLSAGAHLNLSCGIPLTADFPAELRSDFGAFSKHRALREETWAGGRYADSVRAEWQAQIVKLLDSGVKLDHLDSHHHVHLLEPLFPIALELASENKLALRVRQHSRDQARAAGIRTPDGFIEGFYGKNRVDGVSLLAELANTPKDTVEVMCHPGHRDGLLELRSSYVSERQQELATLSDPALVKEVVQRGWVLSGYA